MTQKEGQFTEVIKIRIVIMCSLSFFESMATAIKTALYFPLFLLLWSKTCESSSFIWKDFFLTPH